MMCAAEYTAKAAEATALASAAQTPESKDLWEYVSAQWITLVHVAEAQDGFLDGIKAEEARRRSSSC